MALLDWPPSLCTKVQEGKNRIMILEWAPNTLKDNSLSLSHSPSLSQVSDTSYKQDTQRLSLTNPTIREDRHRYRDTDTVNHRYREIQTASHIDPLLRHTPIITQIPNAYCRGHTHTHVPTHTPHSLQSFLITSESLIVMNSLTPSKHSRVVTTFPIILSCQQDLSITQGATFTSLITNHL